MDKKKSFTKSHEFVLQVKMNNNLREALRLVAYENQRSIARYLNNVLKKYLEEEMNEDEADVKYDADFKTLILNYLKKVDYV